MFKRSNKHNNPRPCIQFMSDLHLERIKYDFNITKAAPILLLAGDIGRFRDRDLYHAFLTAQCSQFDLVLLVAGNHEFYGSSREEGLRIAQDLVDDPAMRRRLHFLNRNTLDIPQSDMTVLGCTLHSHIAPDYTALTNDFARIDGWRVRDHNAEHERDKAWLQASLESLADSRRRVVVVTHYAPSFLKTTHPAKENNALSQCFSSDALREMATWPGAERVSDWVFGHTHWNARFREGGITVQSNQLCNDERDLSWWQKRWLYRPFDMESTISC